MWESTLKCEWMYYFILWNKMPCITKFSMPPSHELWRITFKETGERKYLPPNKTTEIFKNTQMRSILCILINNGFIWTNHCLETICPNCLMINAMKKKSNHCFVFRFKRLFTVSHFQWGINRKTIDNIFF